MQSFTEEDLISWFPRHSLLTLNPNSVNMRDIALASNLLAGKGLLYISYVLAPITRAILSLAAKQRENQDLQ